MEAVRLSVEPSQIGELLPAVGAEGVVFTVTAIVEGELAHPLLMTSVYVPAAAAVTFVMEGFCSVDVKLFGPVHEYVAPETKLDVRFNVLPVQTGELLVTVGAAGGVFTAHTTVPTELVQPLTDTVREYVPAAAAVAPGMVGF